MWICTPVYLGLSFFSHLLGFFPFMDFLSFFFSLPLALDATQGDIWIHRDPHPPYLWDLSVLNGDMSIKSRHSHVSTFMKCDYFYIIQ